MTAGFTLIELILALVILSLLAAMVYSAFHLGHRAVIKGERQADMNQRARMVGEIIARQVRSAVFYFAKYEEDGYPYFIGTADSMSFVSAAPQSQGGTGLAAITYRVVDGNLILEEHVGFTPNDLYEPGEAVIREERAVLLDGFSAIRFEYLPRDEYLPEGKSDSWQHAWDGREEESLPAVVRVTIDGLEFFEFHPWVQEIPLMTVAYGWGSDEFMEPPEEDEDWEWDEDDEDDDDDEDVLENQLDPPRADYEDQPNRPFADQPN